MTNFSSVIVIFYIGRHMERFPYQSPPYFKRLCDDESRKEVFQKRFSYVDCDVDPYYPDRFQIYMNIKHKFNDRIRTNKKSFYEKKKIWQDLLHEEYQKLHLPYTFYDEFSQNCFNIIRNTKSVDVLFEYFQDIQEQKYDPDPFYSFMTLLDYILYTWTFDKKFNKKMLVDIIQKCIEHGYLGITQIRFLMYMAVLNGNARYFHMLSQRLQRLIPMNQWKKLMYDSFLFAFEQSKYPIIQYFQKNYPQTSQNTNIPSGIRDSSCYKKSKKQMNKYYPEICTTK
jgi:hypothetical protein